MIHDSSSWQWNYGELVKQRGEHFTSALKSHLVTVSANVEFTRKTEVKNSQLRGNHCLKKLKPSKLTYQTDDLTENKVHDSREEKSLNFKITASV